MNAPMFWGHHGVDPDTAAGWLVSGEAEEDLTHTPWPPPITAAGLRGSASTSRPVTDPRSDTGPCFDHVIRHKPRPTRAEMPAAWTWLCGPA